MQTFSSKLPRVGTTIFTVMSSLAAENKAINVGQGFPDYPMDPELIERVSDAMKQGHNQYVHMAGLPALRETLSEKIYNLYGTLVSPVSEITITPGGTYAMYTALTSFLQPGDEVIVFEPAYDSYIPNIELNGGIPVCIPLSYPDYRIPWDRVQNRISPKTRALIINSPHNPSGTVLTESDIRELRKLAEAHNLLIISDEVYEHLVFDGKTHQSILRYPDLLARSFVCFSFGKVYHCTGWKLGYCVAPESLMQEFRKVHQFNVFTCNSPMQVALAHHLKNPEPYLTLGSFLQEKRDYLRSLMSQTRFTPIPSHGSYFELYNYQNLSKEPEADFAIRLVKEAGVATIPVAAFYREPVNHQVLRFCFAKEKSTLEQAVSRLISWGA